jgi:hypothetical protein
MNNYPAGVTDNDEHFDLPSGSGDIVGTRKVKVPLTTMVYCPPCRRHWEAPAREDYWNARVELCSKHQTDPKAELGKEAKEAHDAMVDAHQDAQGQY